MEQTYRITQAGRNALESPRSVPDRYRAILGLLRTDTGYSAICGAMPAQGPKQVRTWVEQMETLGFLEVVDPAGRAPASVASTDFGFDRLLEAQRVA
jgi:hypothetical protein